MRTMTKDECEMYILAGFFPKRTEIDSIVELQDVFGHQTYWDCIKWLYNKDTAQNAYKLYKLIWDDTQIDSMLNIINDYKNTLGLYEKLQEQNEHLEELINRNKTEMFNIQNKLKSFHL